MLADTHVHIWDFSKASYSWLDGNTSILNRTYSIDEIAADRKTATVTHGVLVQAANNTQDTDWMLHVAAHTNWIAAVVGWVPLTNPDATANALEHYKSNPYFKGVRHLIHDEPDAQWLLQPTVLESLQLLADAGIPYDVVGILPAHIRTALQVAEKVPQLKLIFDHLNQPPIATADRFGEWGELMQEAAQHPNFYAKISGLGTTAQAGNAWTNATIEPYVSFALQQFGVKRCMLGGDWPVSLLAGSYTYSWQQYHKLLQSLLTPEEQHMVKYANAADFYQFQ